MQVKKEVYNFGKRKPILNCEKLLSEHFWKKYIINKWIYEYDSSEEKFIYYKHLFINSRIIQICYSGIDILGDGVYILYQCEIQHKEEKFDIFPIEYKLLFGSFEEENYLARLYKEKLINKNELEIFSDSIKLKEFTKNLTEINSF